MRRLDPKQTTTLITLRVPTSLANAVARRAKREKRSRSDLLRELIVACMEEWPSVEGELKQIRQEVKALRGDVKKLLGRKGGGR
jgi:hypothetical protein